MFKKLLNYAHSAHAAHRGYAALHTCYFGFVMVEAHGYLVYLAGILAAVTLVFAVLGEKV